MNIYNRHINLFSKEEFTKIRDTKILVAGAGGLGSTVLQLLVRYGFGEIHVFDDGIVDSPDLNRQILYSIRDLGKRKVIKAKELLLKINPDVHVFTHFQKITENTIPPEIDFVIDCIDNFSGRIVMDNLFFRQGIPIIHAGAEYFFSQITTLVPEKTKSYCETFSITEEHKKLDAPKDIFPPCVTTTASIQVSEAVKLSLKKYDQLLLNKILTIDLLNNIFDIIELKNV